MSGEGEEARVPPVEKADEESKEVELAAAGETPREGDSDGEGGVEEVSLRDEETGQRARMVPSAIPYPNREDRRDPITSLYFLLFCTGLMLQLTHGFVEMISDRVTIGKGPIVSNMAYLVMRSPWGLIIVFGYMIDRISAPVRISSHFACAFVFVAVASMFSMVFSTFSAVECIHMEEELRDAAAAAAAQAPANATVPAFDTFANLICGGMPSYSLWAFAVATAASASGCVYAFAVFVMVMAKWSKVQDKSLRGQVQTKGIFCFLLGELLAIFTTAIIWVVPSASGDVLPSGLYIQQAINTTLCMVIGVLVACASSHLDPTLGIYHKLSGRPQSQHAEGRIGCCKVTWNAADRGYGIMGKHGIIRSLFRTRKGVVVLIGVCSAVIPVDRLYGLTPEAQVFPLSASFSPFARTLYPIGAIIACSVYSQYRTFKNHIRVLISGALSILVFIAFGILFPIDSTGPSDQLAVPASLLRLIGGFSSYIAFLVNFANITEVGPCLQKERIATWSNGYIWMVNMVSAIAVVIATFVLGPGTNFVDASTLVYVSGGWVLFVSTCVFCAHFMNFGIEDLLDGNAGDEGELKRIRGQRGGLYEHAPLETEI